MHFGSSKIPYKDAMAHSLSLVFAWLLFSPTHFIGTQGSQTTENSLSNDSSQQSSVPQTVIIWKLSRNLTVLNDRHYIYYNTTQAVTCLTCEGGTYFADVCTLENNASVCPPCSPGSHQPPSLNDSHLQEFCVCDEEHSFWNDSKSCVRCMDCPDGSHLVKNCSTEDRESTCCQEDTNGNELCITYVDSQAGPELTTTTAPLPDSSYTRRHGGQEELHETTKKPRPNVVHDPTPTISKIFGDDVVPGPTISKNFGDDVVPNPTKSEKFEDDVVPTPTKSEKFGDDDVPTPIISNNFGHAAALMSPKSEKAADSNGAGAGDTSDDGSDDSGGLTFTQIIIIVAVCSSFLLAVIISIACVIVWRRRNVTASNNIPLDLVTSAYPPITRQDVTQTGSSHPVHGGADTGLNFEFSGSADSYWPRVQLSALANLSSIFGSKS